MTEKQILSRIIQKHDIETNWNKATNFVPMRGELIVYDIDANYDYERLKIGDGTTSVVDLPFTGGVDATARGLIGDLTTLGTEAQTDLVSAVNELVASVVTIDATLTQEGQAADAAAVGDRLSALSEEIANKAANVYIGPEQPTDGTLYWLDTSESGGSGGETVTYSITAALTNVTIDNTAESANEGESFAASLSVSVGYELSSVKITMGGADITNTAYASGNIYISAVTGDVVITAVAVEISEEVTTYTITNNLVNVTSNNSAVSAEENASYTATLTADDGYTLEGAAVTITMGGVNITTEVYADGVVAIPAVTGDVVISVIGAEYIGEPVSMTFSAGLKGFSSYYSDDGLTLMEKTPRDRGGFYSTVFEVDTKITASFVVADYQNACYGYGLWGYLDGTSRFYGGVYCASGKHEITITVPAGNRFLIMGTYEKQCTNIVVNGKEV